MTAREAVGMSLSILRSRIQLALPAHIFAPFAFGNRLKNLGLLRTFTKGESLAAGGDQRVSARNPPMETASIRPDFCHRDCSSAGISAPRFRAAGKPAFSSNLWRYQSRLLSSRGNLRSRLLKPGFSGSCNFRSLNVRAEAVAVSAPEEVDELADIDWNGLGFGLRPTDYMCLMKCGQEGELFEGDLRPFGTIEISPSAGVLNYGQGLFEGLKAYRARDGRILLFRPEENALRMIMGAERLCMRAPSVEQFVDAVKQTVLANKRWIPPFGKGSLYIRPLLLGSGPVLGLAPAPEYTFLIYVSPVGNYFKEGLAPIHLRVENKYHRATPGGTGGIKSIGNYAPVLKTQSDAKAKGFADVLYLDAINKKYLEEVSSCNIFVLKGNIISTPALQGTILPGITRKSVIEVARSRGYEVQERSVAVDELLDADEVFCTGTAVVVNPVASITYLDKRVTYRNEGLGKVSQELYSLLTSLQMGLSEDTMGWTMELK